ncbi:MAG: hypothetical protein ACTS6G_05595 [Candidatus Hodgkinia cicadicola]
MSINIWRYSRKTNYCDKKNCRRLKKNVLLIRTIRMLRPLHYAKLAMLMKMQFCQSFDTTSAVHDE